MEPQFYTRIAMAGWIFLAVILGSLFETNSPQWQSLLKLMRGENANFATVIFGAIVGIGAPPAVGFLLQRVISVVLWIFGRNMWVYKSNRRFKDILGSELKEDPAVICEQSSGGLFHAFFYTYASSEVLDWARRRRTQMYASLTSALAIIVGLIIVRSAFGVFSKYVGVGSIALAISLAAHGIREQYIHEKAICAWVNTLGRAVSRKFVNTSPREVNDSCGAAGGTLPRGET